MLVFLILFFFAIFFAIYLWDRSIKKGKHKAFAEKQATEKLRRIQSFGKTSEVVGYYVNDSLTFEIAGTFKDSVRDYFLENDYLNVVADLVPEPHNRADSKAISVKFGRRHLGYVPKWKLDAVWPLYELGFTKVIISDIFWFDDPEAKGDFETLHVTATYPFNDKHTINQKPIP